MKTNILFGPDKAFVRSALPRQWGKYRYFVENATKGGVENNEGEIAYWREKLFTNFIIYFLPASLIALVPGIFMSVKEGNLIIGGFDLLVAGGIVVVSLSIKLNITFRKFFVVTMLYVVAVFFLIKLGLYGPGLLYLLAASTFIAVAFSRAVAYCSMAANLFICISCSFIINLKLFNSPLITECSLGAWIAISSNLIFLSTVIIILINHAINNLEDKIAKEFFLKNELKLVNDEKVYHNKLLQESEMHYKSLFLQSPLSMWIMDVNTLQFLQVNEAAIKSYGYTNEEFLSISLKDLKLEKDLGSDSDVESFIEGIKNGLKVGTATSTTRIVEHRRKNGEQFYTEIKYTSITFKGREALLVVARDMTEQINFTKAIEGQNARLSEIAWIQSHVVRVPLARIIGLVDIITTNNEEKPDPEILAYLDQSAKEFDEIIRTITMNSEQINFPPVVL